MMMKPDGYFGVVAEPLGGPMHLRGPRRVSMASPTLHALSLGKDPTEINLDPSNMVQFFPYHSLVGYCERIKEGNARLP